MAQRSKKNEAGNDHGTIVMVEPDGVIVHRRTTDKPIPFIPKLAVRPGISVINLLRSDDEAESERGVRK